MSEDLTKKEVVSISLGSIELSVSDLISLRPGSEIHFEQSTPLEGSLIVAGCQWAKVRMELSGGSGKLRITELNILPDLGHSMNLGNFSPATPIT